MYVIPKAVQEDPVKRWALPDRVFFACGACHILAHAFLEAYPHAGFAPVWIRPGPGYPGNHIVVINKGRAFDYHGYSRFGELLHHMHEKANRWWEGWRLDLEAIPPEALISEEAAHHLDGFQLLAPEKFLHDPIPRARAFLKKYPPP